jgi:hypothetical protein
MRPGTRYSRPQKRTTQILPVVQPEKIDAEFKGEQRQAESKNRTPKLLKTGVFFKKLP